MIIDASRSLVFLLLSFFDLCHLTRLAKAHLVVSFKDDHFSSKIMRRKAFKGRNPQPRHRRPFLLSHVAMLRQSDSLNEDFASQLGGHSLLWSYRDNDDTKPMPNRVPIHVGIVLDGNGRWAKQRNVPISFAHMKGADRVLQIVPMIKSAGVKCCTFYCFSTENWSRPSEEIMDIFSVLEQTLVSITSNINNRGIRIKLIGSREELPQSLLNALDKLEFQTSMQNDDTTEFLTVGLAINYGGRRDIIEATKKIADAILNGEISDPNVEINECLLSSYLSTQGLPDLDLIIRTGGEQRLSNFLLWNAAYAELYFTEVLWPDFDEVCWAAALEWYANRDRRFGARHKLS